MRTLTTCFATLALASAAAGAPTATSERFVLNTAPTHVVTSPLTIGYAPTWIDGVDGSGASVAVYAVAHAGTEQSATTLVHRASADATGVCTYLPSPGSPEAVRLVMSVEKGTSVLGTLTRDVAFGFFGTTTGVAADSRAAALQEVADATGRVPVAYDAAWVDGAVKMRLESVNRTRGKRSPSVVTTNVVASALSGAGVQAWTVPLDDGFDRLLLTFLDAGGQPVGETLESPWFEKCAPPGFLLLLR